jgi:hypothetical protein
MKRLSSRLNNRVSNRLNNILKRHNNTLMKRKHPLDHSLSVFFAPTRYRVIKIVCSYFEVVL